jgi:hypothetical protein
MQIDVIVPEAAFAASYDQVILTVGNFVSPTGVTITVQ